MNARRLATPLLIALSVSSVCTFALSRRLRSSASPQRPMQQYLGLAHSLEAGEVIHPETLRAISWPADNPVPGAFVSPSELAGRAVLYPVDPNQPITERMVSAPGAGVGLAGRIPDGMRAIALKSDEVMGVAGFLLPGTHLDVLVTFHTDASRDPRTVTVLQNAEVIAAGHQVQPDPQGKPATVDVVTLLLSPADAERAVLASTQGVIHFVLRGGSDQGRTRDDGILLSQLGGPAEAASSFATLNSHPDRPATVAPAPARPSRPALVHQTTVQTISGDKQVLATFDEAGK